MSTHPRIVAIQVVCPGCGDTVQLPVRHAPLVRCPACTTVVFQRRP